MHGKTKTLALVFLLSASASASTTEGAPVGASLNSDATCHTLDSQTLESVRYDCFVHSRQSLGEDVSTSDSRASLIERRLSVVCSESSVLSDELFISEGTPPVHVWRIVATCKLDG